MDPALYGLIGTGVGGFIGFAGTWFSTRTTARSTAEREERARLFTEKKKSYANAADVLSTVVNELFDDDARLADFESKHQTVRPRFYAAYYDLLIISGESLVADELRKFNHYWVETTRYALRIAKTGPEHANIAVLQGFKKNKQELRWAVGNLVLAMREDLRPAPRPERAWLLKLPRRKTPVDQGASS